jgi:acyl-coenzyme A synthetase/AMP-(fatty) acid ligase
VTPEIINCLRLPGAAAPPRLVAFETFNGRVIAGAVVSADRSSWAPVHDGVVALSQISAGPPPTSAGDLVQAGIPSPLCSGHREWASTTDPDLARVPFGAIAEPLLAHVAALATGLQTGAVVVVIGDDSGWAACSAAALLPDQVVIAVFDEAGPLGLAGCRRWLASSDGPGNLTAVVSATGTRGLNLEAAAIVIEVAALRPSAASAPAVAPRPETLHALINPDAAIDLNRGQIGERILSDAETKVLYWASRAVSVTYTAERTGYGTAEVIAILAGLHTEGFVRLQQLPPAMARLHVFWSTGEAILPLAEQTLGHIAKFGFHHFADRIFIHNADDGGAITFAEAAFVIARTAAALHSDGVRPGDRICVHAIAHLEVPPLFWACVHLGAVFVPIGSNWSREVAATVLDRCNPRLFFINDEITNQVPEHWRSRAIRLDPAGDTADPNAREILFSNWLSDCKASDEIKAHHAGPDEPAVILFTSGTTGVPKGTLLSNAAMTIFSLSNAQLSAMHMDDVIFAMIEATGTRGLRDGNISAVICGGATVIADPARRRNVFGFADICRIYGVTQMSVVAASLRWFGQINDRVAPETFHALRVINSGASPLHQKTLNAIEALKSTRVLDNLGSMEALQIAASSLLLKQASISVHGGYTHGNIAQTVNEAGDVIRDGGIGRLRYYGDRMMIGYLDDPQLTAEVMQDGWVYTGDMAAWEPDGPLHIVGRDVEMIKSAWGDKVFPSEVEAALMTDPRVFEVAASGCSDGDGIEYIAAFVTPSSRPADPDRLVEDLKNRVREVLGSSKVRRVIVLVDDMPRLARDKINKSELVTRYLQPK